MYRCPIPVVAIVYVCGGGQKQFNAISRPAKFLNASFMGLPAKSKLTLAQLQMLEGLILRLCL
jgi:hypothetical protein